MWLKDEVIYPRFLRSLLWMILLHYVFVNGFLLFFKIISWYPLSGVAEWLFCIFHWRTLIHLTVLSVSIVAFGVLNLRLSAVEKHVNSTRFEKICRAFSPHTLQYFFSTMALGGLTSYCYDCLFYNFHNSSFIYSWLFSANEFEQTFVIGHGCFIGIMFSLKYFICNSYLINFSLDEEPKIYHIERQTYELIKDSFYCVIKSVHWYYLAFILFGSPLKLITFSYLGNITSDTETIIYSLLSLKLFILCFISGTAILFTWSMYLDIFNSFSTKHHKFPIKVPVKGDKNRTLHSALACKESVYLKYLAAIDLRLLAQFDSQRREQVFAISHPGGHPHEWNAISGVCINLLQGFLYRLNEHSFAAAAASDSKTFSSKVPKVFIERIQLSNGFSEKPMLSLSEKILCYFREKPTVMYFFDELPNAKLKKLFAPSQPFIWIIDALGYLISASYCEDTYGVVQQTLPEIIRLLLDIKMAEEKMPAGLVGIRTYVKDPQGRYDHVHQRISLRNTVNNALCRIANTFNVDINGIYLPEEYQKYFQRYLNKKN